MQLGENVNPEENNPLKARKPLEGKNAIVTGSDSGIGRAIALEFAKNGANVVICYHKDQQAAAGVIREIQALGQRSLEVQVDVGQETAIDNLFDRALEQFKTIDILVNNAGTNGAKKQVIDMTTAEFDRTLRSDLYGPFFACRRFARHRIQQGGKGKIINITSIHEEVMFTDAADYNVAKGGLRNLTRTLALELGRHWINVNNIGPGMIVTPMNKDLMESAHVRAEKGKAVPLSRPGYPEEIAQLALYLASPSSDYVTGATYFIDGGLMLKMAREV
jgi:glucose 1-dehydrogenase